MARQFNLIPPVCEQAEYHLFQREKVEVQLPELYHKIGKCYLLCVVYYCGKLVNKCLIMKCFYSQDKLAQTPYSENVPALFVIDE